MMLMPWQERPLVDLPLSQLRDVTLARLKEMDRANASANVIAYYDANLCFHWKIIAASGYAQILAVYRGIVQKLYLARLTNLSSNVGIQISVHEHRAIFDSIRNGKPAECEALMANHVTAAKVRLFSLSKQGVIMQRRTTFKTIVAGVVLLCAPVLAIAQDTWPTKTIKIIAPVQPGGGVDLVARLVADRLGKVLGQSIIVENMSGGGGIVGSQAAARAAPDGYTLMLGYVGTHGTNPALRKLPYDAIKDFTPIAMVGGTPNILVVNPTVPANTLKEFIAYAKANPNSVSYGSAGQGTLTHLAMEQLKEETGINVAHAPYRGIGPALTDLLGAQTQAVFPGLAAALPHIKAGKLRPLAITGAQRHPLMPNVPTLAELGFTGFDGVQWYGIVGPAKMPPALVRRLNTEINKLIAAPELKEKLSGEALEPMPMSPEQFGEYMKNDIAKWEKLVKARKIEIKD